MNPSPLAPPIPGPPWKRVDLQLLAMIRDARTRLKAQGIDGDGRVMLAGFSASGSFREPLRHAPSPRGPRRGVRNSLDHKLLAIEAAHGCRGVRHVASRIESPDA